MKSTTKRNGIGEAYTRVMRKAWRPGNGSELKRRGQQFRPLTEQTASMYVRAMFREWAKLGYRLPKAADYLKTVDFVPAYQGRWAQRRSFNQQIALTNWYDLNHELSHWVFWKYSRATRRTGNGQQHHCDRHLEWERTGAEWICRRMIEDKPFRLEE